MEYIKATEQDLRHIVALVQETIRTIYPKYYPKEVVDFFCELHCQENIFEDIKAGLVGVLKKDGEILGTGCRRDNHITRVYVKPAFQKQGYGSYIMQCLENEVGLQHDRVYLDSSLPASRLYEKRGYETIQHNCRDVENGVLLVYEVMEKRLTKCSTHICYDGKHFVSEENAENGEVNGNTVFVYHQSDNILWAEYSGGEIVRGYLVGTVAENGELDFYYQHINAKKQVRVGVCHSIPNVLENGKIQLLEKWQWLNGDKTKGSSLLVEV